MAKIHVEMDNKLANRNEFQWPISSCKIYITVELSSMRFNAPIPKLPFTMSKLNSSSNALYNIANRLFMVFN